MAALNRANLGVFMIELKSEQVKKVAEGGRFYTIFPYMSFCTPDLAGGSRQP
ncbi:hypothetical protein DAI22_07g014800 [Oryza sativa Japonica Group]|nr:hypothetical protein DAI22_07g014800 [Oryza sativa Japonica Group]